MPGATVYDLVTDLIADNWTHTTIRSVDSDIALPETRTAFAELTFPVRPREEQVSVGDPGNNLYRTEGGAYFCVFVPVNELKSTWLTRLDTLRSAMRGHVSTDGNFRIYGVDPPFMGGNSERLGYYELSITALYEFDLYG